VTEGLAIPFGAFRRLLEQPRETGAGGDETALEWMVAGYRKLEALPEGSPERQAAAERFRGELHDWIAAADPGDDFRRRLKQAMTERFGPDGSYGVFVRSDTNVEDLPGFTGAGLNLTVANAVGFEAVAAAVSRVWASPFTARAFAWRQSRMDQPEHVYPAVLLLKSVAAEKSGVLVTQYIDSCAPGWLSVSVNASSWPAAR
jgi:phosphoenolpyruvate synthase/pyruvate phosphate dikinase